VVAAAEEGAGVGVAVVFEVARGVGSGDSSGAGVVLAEEVDFFRVGVGELFFFVSPDEVVSADDFLPFAFVTSASIGAAMKEQATANATVCGKRMDMMDDYSVFSRFG
jgi:hypothetical protein